MNCKMYRNWQNKICQKIFDVRKERLSLMFTEAIKKFDKNLITYKWCDGKHHFKGDGVNVDVFLGYCPTYTGIENDEAVQEIEEEQAKKKENKIFTFDNYEGNKKEVENIRSFYKNTLQKNMILIGFNGTGKSHICQALQTELIKNNISAEYILYSELEKKFFEAQTWNSDKYERGEAKKRILQLIKTECLIIDDFGKDMNTKSEIPGNELFIILEKMQGKLVITTNKMIDTKESYDKADNKTLYLNYKFDNRIISRLLSGVTVVNLKGSDYRTKDIK